MRDQIVENVISAIASVKRIPRSAISMDSSFSELGLDSLDAVNILFEVEDRLQISVPDVEVRSLRDVRGIVEGVERLIAAHSSASTELS